ncbi:MAG: 2-dehydropantoate 2-reductase [Desulfobacteraceae bacterium]|nr:2-dehydropantoate 2-reductase [Desulfobacteraceae bacterium]
MNFLVVGPGAMGCLFAARLKKAGHIVKLVDHSPERADHINAHGIRVEGVTGEYKVPVPTVVGRVSEKPDVALICVKANRTRDVGEALATWLSKKTHILTLQNGIGNLEILQEALGDHTVLGGVTAQGATVLSPGHVRHAGEGETVIGPEGHPVGEIVSAFNRAGFDTRSVRDVNSLIWGKLIVNVGINALTAITRLKNGRLPEIEGTRRVMEEAVGEAVAVAEAKDVNLPYPDPIERVLEVCRATSGNIASMLQDILNQRITEVDFINGAIVREATALGIAAPVNRTLTSLVKAIHGSYGDRIDGQ